MTNDLIVLLPGIGGSRLEREGKPIYDLSVRALPRLIWNWVGGGLAFAGGSGKPDDGVVATALFNNQLIPGFFGIDDYDGLLDTLRAVVPQPAQQVMAFPYDWRASNRWAAEALDAAVRPRLHAWRQGAGGDDAKLWLVCHSMGGLVARYFLEHLGGAEITRHLVTIGTPHRGAPKALNALVNGLGIGPLDFSRVIRSFASTYELLPQHAMVRVGDADDAPLARVADFFGLGTVLPTPAPVAAPPAGLGALPHIEAERLRDALQFHAAIRQPVIRRLQDGAPTPYTITCFFNRRQATPQSARWAGGVLAMSDALPVPAYGGVFHRGDGTVPGPCAVPIEWRDTAQALAIDDMHVALPSAQAVTDILHNLASPLDVQAYMSPGTNRGTIGLAVPPLVLAGEPFEVVVDVARAAQLTVRIADAEGLRPPLQQQVQVAEDASAALVFTLREPGSYRVTARSVDPMRPAIDDWIVAVSPP